MLQTQGFRLSNLARFAPADPSLVAFNPSAFTTGMRDAFGVGAALDELRAARLRNEEASKTSTTRVDATNAANLANILRAGAEQELIPLRTEDEKGEMGSKAAIRPLQTKNTLSDLAAQLQLRPGEIAAKTAEQGARISEAGVATSTAPKRIEGSLSQISAQIAKDDMDARLRAQRERTERARMEKDELADAAAYESMLATADLRTQQEVMQLEDAIRNFGEDSAIGRQLKKMQIDLLKSQIAENEANAIRSATPKPADVLEEARKISALITEEQKRLMSTGMGIDVYLKNTRDADTGQLTVKESELIPEFEQHLNNLNALRQRQLELGRLIHGQDTTPRVKPQPAKGPQRFRLDASGNVVQTR